MQFPTYLIGSTTTVQHDLPAPVDPANPDLEMITPIPELERLAAFPKIR
jgi:hypothetical protein